MSRGALAAAIIVVIVVVAAGVALLGRGGHGGATSNTTTTTQGALLSLPLRSGDVLRFNVSWAVYSPVNGSMNLTSSSYLEDITVVKFSGDYLIEANLTSGNKTGTGSIPYGLLALPGDRLGSPSIDAPILTPLGGVCMHLTLEGEVEWRGPEGHAWSTYAYRSTLDGPGYVLSYYGLYNASTGLVVEANSTAVLIGRDGNTTVSFAFRLVSYKPSGGSLLEERLGAGSFCRPPASSDLRLCADGFYKIENGMPRMVSADTINSSVKGPAVVVILNKYCPHCQRFWPNIIEAARSVNAPLYVIVFSGDVGLSNPLMSATIHELMSAAGALGQGLPTPSIIVFPGHGSTPAYRAGEMSESQFVDWVNTVLKRG